MKRFFSALLVLFFLQTQSYARASTHALNTEFNQLAHGIIDGQMNAASIVSHAKKIVSQARASGVSEEQFLGALSEKMSLNMSKEQIAASIEEMRSNPSEAKVEEIAKQLENSRSGDKVFMVLLTFALMSMLMIGIFFLLVDPNFPL